MRAAPSGELASVQALGVAEPAEAQAGTKPSPVAAGWVARLRGGPWRWWLGLAGVLVGALGLRLWGVAQGLPYVYNSDENDHFVPHAVKMFEEGLNPRYFANPPALTYLLHGLYAVWFGGGRAVLQAYQLHPTEVYVLGRVAVALLGTAAVWLLYLVGARLFSRGVALLAAALEAVAFLPVFYAHLALNDVPTLAPLTLSLLGTAGVLRKGRRRDYLLAGVGLGIACATKYTAGIVVLPLLAAAVAQYAEHTPDAGRRVAQGLALAGGAALVAFLAANPYALLDAHKFKAELDHQSQLSGEPQGKLGAGHAGGVRYYLWSLTWGLGWVPALAALGGALTIWRTDRRLGWLLVPAPLLFLAFMGLQGRYFGRWLLPIFPIVCLLAAHFALQLAATCARRAQRLATRHGGGPADEKEEGREPRSASPAGGGASPTPPPRAGRGLSRGFAALAVVALCAQGLIYSVHSDRVLSRKDTRTLTREWMVAHIPQSARIVAEPVSPDAWADDIGHFNPATTKGSRWEKYDDLRPAFSANGTFLGESESTRPSVGIEDYERTLRPELIAYYESEGYCWVISGSTQYGRAYAEPAAVPEAIAYYKALARQGQVVYHASPYSPGAHPVGFNFDWSFDYYPLAYERPGPEMTVYRLHGGRCGG
jgi:Dolichyl-phosphate-mannose-protein mannosyltransferase